MNKKEIFDRWFNSLKDVEIKKDGHPFKKIKSNSDRAFYDGYTNVRLSNNRKRFPANSIARTIYNAGQAVRRHQDRK